MFSFLNELRRKANDGDKTKSLFILRQRRTENDAWLECNSLWCCSDWKAFQRNNASVRDFETRGEKEAMKSLNKRATKWLEWMNCTTLFNIPPFPSSRSRSLAIAPTHITHKRQWNLWSAAMKGLLIGVPRFRVKQKKSKKKKSTNINIKAKKLFLLRFISSRNQAVFLLPLDEKENWRYVYVWS